MTHAAISRQLEHGMMRLPFLRAAVAAALLATSPPLAAEPPTTTHSSAELAKKGTSKRKPKPAKSRPAKQPSPPQPPPAPRTVTPRPAAPIPPMVAPAVDLPLLRSTLANGMRVVLAPDHAIPAVAITVAYAAGPSLERPGQEGLARLLHGAMKGPTTTLRPGDFDRRVRALSGVSRQRLGPDLATYTTTLPAGALQVGLWLESQRMLQLVLDENWLRARADQASRLPPDPTTLALDAVASLAYQGGWPYGHAQPAPPALSPDVAALRAFRNVAHAPGNATIVVVGSFDAGDATRWIDELFSSPKPSRSPGAVTPIAVPEQINQRNRVAVSPNVTRPWFLYGWTVPEGPHPDHTALQLAALVLGSPAPDHTGQIPDRLRRLPPEARLRVALDQRRGPSLLTLHVEIDPDGDIDRTREIVHDAIAELAATGPTEAEMRAAWLEAEQSLLARLEVPADRAELLASQEMLQGDARTVATLLSGLFATNREEVRSAIARYLGPIRRNRVELRRPPQPRPAPSEARPRDQATSPARASTPATASPRRAAGAGNSTAKPARRSPRQSGSTPRKTNRKKKGSSR